MEILLHHIQDTTGRATRAGCEHPARYVCSGCFQVAYCGQNCQTAHACVGTGMKRSREEEQFIDLDQLRDLWGLIQPWLSADDLKNLRLASREIEQRIRRAYFSRFRVRLTQASFAQFRPELAPFITKVDDTESGGRLALWLSRAQHNSALKDVLIDPEITDYNGIDWNSITQIRSLEVLTAGTYDTQTTLPESITNLSNLQELKFYGVEPNSGLIELKLLAKILKASGQIIVHCIHSLRLRSIRLSYWNVRRCILKKKRRKKKKKEKKKKKKQTLRFSAKLIPISSSTWFRSSSSSSSAPSWAITSSIVSSINS